MSLSIANLPLNWMPENMSDVAASHQPGCPQSCHGVGVAADEDCDIGSQLPAVVVTVVLMQMYRLQGHAGYCQRTMLAC